MKKISTALLTIAALVFLADFAHATTSDRDNDGISDDAEIQVYGTDPNIPNTAPAAAKIDFRGIKNKRIEIDLSEQRLRYYGDNQLLGVVPISSGIARLPTPKGAFAVRAKIPVKTYIGRDYYYPNTKWNMRFLPGYYIHGTYWHNDFGIRPRSHGCVNVPYASMEKLYAFADVGTRVIIRN